MQKKKKTDNLKFKSLKKIACDAQTDKQWTEGIKEKFIEMIANILPQLFTTRYAKYRVDTRLGQQFSEYLFFITNILFSNFTAPYTVYKRTQETKFSLTKNK